MLKSTYNRCMAKEFDIDLYDSEFDFKKLKGLSGQQINQLMQEVHSDCEYLIQAYAPRAIIRHYHELLSKLIKRHGH
jgi:hypothetical protein